MVEIAEGMSRYSGNSDKCPHGCGLTYGKLRTGLRYYDVFTMLMDNRADRDEWKYKRRHTVLGAWFQIKRSMWDYHCDEGGCPSDPRNIVAESTIVLGDAVQGDWDAHEDEAPF